jgi:O-antigen/teichoic acid export membrane protein
MTTCEEFQIAIERQSHGGLEASSTSQLEEHLRACSDCQQYKALARFTEETMQLAADKLSERVDWNRILERLRATDRKYLRATVRTAVVAAILVGVGLAYGGSWLVGFGAGMALCVPFYLVRVYFRSRRLNRIGNDRRQILVAYRSEVDRSILTAWSSVAFCVVGAVIWLALAPKFGAFAYGACGVSLMLAGYWWLRTLPRLRRERGLIS